MTTISAVEQIKAFQPDPSRFIQQGRGYVDWRFGQVAQYLGYAKAIDYVQAMRRWYNFESQYKTCLLNVSYEAFERAQNTEQDGPQNLDT